MKIYDHDACQDVNIGNAIEVAPSSFAEFEASSRLVLEWLSAAEMPAGTIEVAAILNTKTPTAGLWPNYECGECRVDGTQRVVCSIYIHFWFCDNGQFVRRIGSLTYPEIFSASISEANSLLMEKVFRQVQSDLRTTTGELEKCVALQRQLGSARYRLFRIMNLLAAT